MYHKKTERGFTLIELLVVIAIIGILASITLASMSGVREKGKIAKAQADIKQIHLAIFALEEDTNLWPGGQVPYKINSVAGNEICKDSGECQCNFNDACAGIATSDIAIFPEGWRGPYYLPEVPLDPWGNGYFFDTDYDIDPDPAITKISVVIGSYGPDGIGHNLYDSDEGGGDNIIYSISSGN